MIGLCVVPVWQGVLMTYSCSDWSMSCTCVTGGLSEPAGCLGDGVVISQCVWSILSCGGFCGSSSPWLRLIQTLTSIQLFLPSSFCQVLSKGIDALYVKGVIPDLCVLWKKPRWYISSQQNCIETTQKILVLKSTYMQNRFWFQHLKLINITHKNE